MAIKLSANYSKKIGLPEFSSHSFSVSVEVELIDISQVEAESQRLYALLQQSVDQEIQHPGFVPEAKESKGNGHQQTQNGRTYHLNGNGTHQPRPANEITVGQKSFIQRILHDNQMDKDEPENLSQKLFRTSVEQLNKMQASQLIEDLLAKAGKPVRPNRWRQQRPTTQAA